jgi:hypothetical protein
VSCFVVPPLATPLSPVFQNNTNSAWKYSFGARQDRFFQPLMFTACDRAFSRSAAGTTRLGETSFLCRAQTQGGLTYSTPNFNATNCHLGRCANSASADLQCSRGWKKRALLSDRGQWGTCVRARVDHCVGPTRRRQAVYGRANQASLGGPTR